jgi:hypothetical protein
MIVRYGSGRGRTPISGYLLLLGLIAVPNSFCQQPAANIVPQSQPPATNAVPQNKRILWIIPNYRTSPTLANYKPLTTGGKFKLAARDAFDPGTFVLAGGIAGIAQARNDQPSFGQGAAGYGRYFGTAYGDLAIGDFMTGAIYPSLLRQDPRYFRRGTGSTLSRLGYAMGQIFWTHTDSGGTQFNYSEVFGNATAVAISNAYYPDNRDASSNAVRLGVQLGLDAAGNVLKEFWPDTSRKSGGKKKPHP